MITLLLALTALNDRPLNVEAITTREKTDIQTCIARRWGRTMNVNVIASNVEIRYIGPFSRSNALMFTIDDVKDFRRITMTYQRPWSASGATKWFRKTEQCWTENDQ